MELYAAGPGLSYNTQVPPLYGGDLASTWVVKPEVHAELQLTRKTDCKKLSCQRRQLRTSSLKTCLSALRPMLVHERWSPGVDQHGIAEKRAWRRSVKTLPGSLKVFPANRVAIS